MLMKLTPGYTTATDIQMGVTSVQTYGLETRHGKTKAHGPQACPPTCFRSPWTFLSIERYIAKIKSMQKFQKKSDFSLNKYQK
jgi:hypothetical protein